MEHYVTLFDSLFLPQGISLHMSMERHIQNYTLWILCVDDDTYDVLTKLHLKNVKLLQLCKLEIEEMLKVKSQRTTGEYCWTLTPFAPRFVLEADKTIKQVTYLDADLWFRKNPKPILDEFEASTKDVLITEHAYAPEYDMSQSSGKYCVQFMTFKRRKGGEFVRKWWEERCIDWCYARYEQGKFGDQKYLDDWPNRFHDFVHVLVNKDLALAPWNATRFPYSNAVFWHFHGYRISKIFGIHLAIFGAFPTPKIVFDNVYKNYSKDLRVAISMLFDVGYTARNQFKFSIVNILRIAIAPMLTRIFSYKIFNFEKY